MIQNTGIEVIISMALGAFTAQLLKFIFYYMKHKRLNFKMFAITGGMPSSHSSFAAALTTNVGLLRGFDSVEFAIALGFAVIVMYDAAGLRRSAGKMATLVNKIVEDFYAERETKTTHDKLMEVLGHTPLEVLMGALLGVVIAMAVHSYFVI